MSDDIYDCGEINDATLKMVQTLNIYMNFDINSEIISIMEGGVYSFLIRKYDNDHHEHFSNYKGKLLHINTEFIPNNCPSHKYHKYIELKIDCSDYQSSNIVKLKLSDIVDIKDINYTFVPKEKKDYIPDIPKSNWEEINYNTEANIGMVVK